MRALSKFSKLFKISGCFLILAACQEDPTHLVENIAYGGALGTSYTIKYYTPEPLNLEDQIDSVFTVVNQSMSTYWPDSDISKINRGDSTLVVDAMFVDVFTTAREVYEKTDGYFDPTVGVLVDAWGFGPGAAITMDSTAVDSLMEYVGFGKVALTPDHRIRKQKPQIRFDFNAIAKGYSIDRLGALLDANKVPHYLIEVGGELLAKGFNPDKEKPWLVGIVDPEAKDSRTPKRTLTLTDRAMASSGNYLKFRIDSLTGNKVVHTIDPLTGYTKNSNVLATSVLASDCSTADAYATAFMAMDLEDSKALLEETSDLEAYIIYVDASGTTKEFMTPGFRKQLPSED